MSERRVLVTGASTGIGRKIVEHYTAAGWQVAGCSRTVSTFSSANYRHYEIDVAAEADIQRMMSDVRDRFGGLDALINGAGIASMNPIALTPTATARRVVDVNFLGTFLCTRAALRLLRKSPAGRIVNFTTVAAPLRLEGEAVYAAAKSAVETLTRITAREVGSFGITCNAVGPCPVRTRLTESVPKAAMERLIARQAIPRWADADDVINVIEFFLSPASGMVTGQVVYLGGVG